MAGESSDWNDGIMSMIHDYPTFWYICFSILDMNFLTNLMVNPPEASTPRPESRLQMAETPPIIVQGSMDWSEAAKQFEILEGM